MAWQAFILVLVLCGSFPQVNCLYKCANESWTLFGSKCYSWSSTTQGFGGSVAYCESINATMTVFDTPEENQLFKGNAYMGDHVWMGLTSSDMCLSRISYLNGTCWTFKEYVSTRSSNKYMWTKENAKWTPTLSYEYLTALCDQQAVCADGYGGSDCLVHTHCYGVTYTPGQTTCKYGCLKRWTGDLCDKPKTKAKAVYYCLKSQNRGNEMNFFVDPKGVDYRSMYAVDNLGQRISQCGKKQFKVEGNTLVLNLHGINSTDTRCGIQMMTGNKFKWKFFLSEYPHTQSMFDVLFDVVCDFDKADHLKASWMMRHRNQSIVLKPVSNHTLALQFSVTDPYTRRDLVQAKLGQNAALLMKLKPYSTHMGVLAFSPYSCSIAAGDGAIVVPFIDANGCEVPDSEIQMAEHNGTVWRSKPFRVFTFRNHDNVQFSCQLHVCFSSDDALCLDQCRHKLNFNPPKVPV